MAKITKFALALKGRFVKYFNTAKNLLKASVIGLDNHDLNIVLDVPNMHNYRPILFLANHVLSANKSLFVISRPDIMTYALASQAKFHKNLRFLWRKQFDPKHVVFMTDDSRVKNGFGKLVYIKYDYQPTLQLPDSSHLVMPFPMHPHTYYYEPSPIPLNTYRLTPRKYQVLFVGNSAPGYATKSIVEDCNVLDRHTILSYLGKNPLFYSRVSQTIEWHRNLEDLSIPEDRTYVILISVRVWQENWLRTLAQSNFALCPPGVKYPLSHNLVEAMSVGTIPILNYTDWLFPRLQDGVNCIEFRTLDELDNKIQEISRMSDEQIAVMRQAVIDYYDQYLSPARFAARLLSSDEQYLTLHVLDDPQSH